VQSSKASQVKRVENHITEQYCVTLDETAQNGQKIHRKRKKERKKEIYIEKERKKERKKESDSCVNKINFISRFSKISHHLILFFFSTIKQMCFETLRTLLHLNMPLDYNFSFVSAFLKLLSYLLKIKMTCCYIVQ